jgi:hypothetical protein
MKAITFKNGLMYGITDNIKTAAKKIIDGNSTGEYKITEVRIKDGEIFFIENAKVIFITI